MTEYHCEYCMAPKELGEPKLMTYDGNVCKLYDDFCSVCWEMEHEGRTSFSFFELFTRCQREFSEDYPDIPDFGATIKEMVDIQLKLGVLRSINGLLHI